jgi:hypothetical protein
MNRSVIAVCLVVSLSGCQLPDWRPPAPIPVPVPTIVPTPAPTPTVSPYAADELDLSTVSWLRVSYAKAKIAATITDAWTNGKNLYTSYKPYSGPGWPVMFGDSPKPVDAIICIFYDNGAGQVIGGKFDWWRVNGAPIKGLENCYPRDVVQPDGSVVTEPGYWGHTGPARGAPCWEMIVSTDGKLRSNAKRVVWK